MKAAWRWPAAAASSTSRSWIASRVGEAHPADEKLPGGGIAQVALEADIGDDAAETRGLQRAEPLTQPRVRGVGPLVEPVDNLQRAIRVRKRRGSRAARGTFHRGWRIRRQTDAGGKREAEGRCATEGTEDVLRSPRINPWAQSENPDSVTSVHPPCSR